MKKNVMMRLSALLLVAVLLTTCVISGTFAKYVTSTPEKSDSAKVAKWGIKMEITGADEVLNEFEGEQDAIASVLTNDLCAPGTYEELAIFTLSGQPEVAYEIAVTVDLALANWTVGSEFYCPLVFSVAETQIDGKNYTSATDLEAAVENEIKKAIAGTTDSDTDLSKEIYKAGTDAAKTVLIDWTWAFDGDDVDDVKDTALGDAAAEGTPATLGFKLQVTITQVDHVA